MGKHAGAEDSQETGARQSRCKLLIDVVDTSIRGLGATLQDEGAFPYFVESDVQVDLSCRLRTNLERSGLLVAPAAGIYPGLPVRDRKVSLLHTEFGGRTKLEAVRYDIALLDTDEALDAYYWPVVVGIEIKLDFFWNPKKIIDEMIYDARKAHDPRVEVVLLYCCASSQMAVEDVDRSIGKDIREQVKRRSYLVWPKGMCHYSPD